jgi:thymidylate synthase (FAD)
MILTKPSATLELMITTSHFLEEIGRVCYKSEDKITPESSSRFINTIMSKGHLSVIEHSLATVRFVIDRGVSHELVRHRLCAFSQESTRYCDYKGGVEFIIPPWVDVDEGEYSSEEIKDICTCTYESDEFYPQSLWLLTMDISESVYKSLRSEGWSPQQARSVLPNSLKTEIVVSANYREWLHIFSLRCSKSAHPQMREVMIPLAEEFAEAVPEIFGEWE